jgi:hypothetical protein
VSEVQFAPIRPYEEQLSLTELFELGLDFECSEPINRGFASPMAFSPQRFPRERGSLPNMKRNVQALFFMFGRTDVRLILRGRCHAVRVTEA